MRVGVETSHIYQEFLVGDGSTLRVLHDVNLKAARGEVTMIVGPSGCGKTTLLSIVSGILTPTRGEVYVFGTNLTTLTDAQKVTFRRENVGFIFQAYNLVQTLSVAENAAIPLLASGVPYAKAIEVAHEMLAHLGLKGKEDKFPLKLSGGEQQRVSIARALVHNPKILVCDEPTAALDAAAGQKVMELLTRMALDKERVVLVVTHDNRIFKFADRIVKMSDGRIMSTESMKRSQER